jgi:hypothetical protein
VDALSGGEDDVVILADPSESAEERIAMACNHHISRSAREGRGWDVPHRLSQDIRIVTFQHHDGYAELGYLHPPQEGAYR